LQVNHADLQWRGKGWKDRGQKREEGRKGSMVREKDQIQHVPSSQIQQPVRVTVHQPVRMGTDGGRMVRNCCWLRFSLARDNNLDSFSPGSAEFSVDNVDLKNGHQDGAWKVQE